MATGGNPQVNVLRCRAEGARRAKGEFEGTPYDYTKLTVLLPQDTSKGDAIGNGATEYTIGKSDRFNAVSGWGFPCDVEIDLVQTVKGGVVRQVVADVRKVKA